MKGRSCSREGQSPAALPGTDEPLLPQCPLAPRGLGIVSDGGTQSSSWSGSGHLSLGRNLLRLALPAFGEMMMLLHVVGAIHSYSFPRLVGNFYMSPSGRLQSLALEGVLPKSLHRLSPFTAQFSSPAGLQ